MEKLNKAFRFRLKPNTNQEILIHKTFGSARLIYNKFLAQRIEMYKDDKKSITYNTQAKLLVPLKKELEFLKEVDSMALQISAKNLDIAYKKFFKGLSKFPKFKSKRNSRKSYTTNNVNNSIRIENNIIRLPKLKLVKFVNHRTIPNDHNIKSVTISQEPNGAYYVSVLTEYYKEIKETPSNGNIVGLDFSMKELFVSSDNQRANYPRFFRKLETKLAKEQRKLSRKIKGSSNFKKQKLKVGRVHQSIKNARKDFLHKLSTNLVNKYNAIAIEDLNMKDMSRALKFGKSVSDNGWGMFTTMLEYKAKLQGKQVAKIDKWFPSSKTCSSCGAIKSNLKLSDREYNCDCGFSIDRDLNASINIKTVGQTMLAY